MWRDEIPPSFRPTIASPTVYRRLTPIDPGIKNITEDCCEERIHAINLKILISSVNLEKKIFFHSFPHPVIYLVLPLQGF